MEEGKFTVVDGGKGDRGPMIPGRSQVENPHPTQFIGTPDELEIALRRLFFYQRQYLIAQTSEAGEDGIFLRGEDGGLVPTDEQEGVLDTFERTVWKVDITPLDKVAKTRCRHAFESDAERMRTERELYELLAKGSFAGVDDETSGEGMTTDET